MTGAADCSRAAVLTTSPAAMPSPSPGARPSDTSASPVVTPIRTWSSPSSRAQSRIASAARTARSGSSSCATGAPKSAIDRVADELLDRAAEALELGAQPLVVRPEHRLDVLGVELLGARGEADEVGEEHRHDLALAARAQLHPLDRVAVRLAARRSSARAVLLVAGHQRQLDLALAHRDVHALAVVLDRDDVHPLLGDQRQQLDQLARPVGHARAHDEVAARERQPVAHDRDQQRRVDVAAREHGDDRRRSRRPCREQERRDADGARALDDELRALEQEHDRLR